MGCVFSRREALSFRKKKKMPKMSNIRDGLERLPTSLPGVHPANEPTLKKRPITSHGAYNKNIQFINENIPQEYSTLAFLAGGKNFPSEDMVFNKVLPGPVNVTTEPATPAGLEAVQEVRPTPYSAPSTLKFPDCLSYKGRRKHHHLFWVDSEEFCRSPDCVAHILDVISSIIGGGWVMVVFKQQHYKTAYLPHQLDDAGDLFDALCTRFRRQLVHIILYNPSWYVLTCLAEQQRTRKPTLYCLETMKNIKFIKERDELEEWTGFPEDVDCQV